MSLATLKRKTAAKYHNSSVGQPAFSLNGTHRSQGYVGQDSLGRRYMSPTSTNDVSVLKPSVLGTSGQIATQYRWIRRPAPYSALKPDDHSNYATYQDYVLRQKNESIKATSSGLCPHIDAVRTNYCDIVSNSIPLRRGQAKIFGSYATNSKAACVVTKDLSGDSKSQSTHILHVVSCEMSKEPPIFIPKPSRCAGVLP